jgi:phosphoribosylformylglycinamidine cyclo-ligase
VAEEILAPTKIYVKPVLKVLEKYFDHVHGLAHITGSAFLKLRRLKSDVRFEITLPQIPPIFKKMQELGVDEKEMYRTFNCGIGFCIVVDALKGDEIAKGLDGEVVGEIKKGKGISVNGIEIED